METKTRISSFINRNKKITFPTRKQSPTLSFTPTSNQLLNNFFYREMFGQNKPFGSSTFGSSSTGGSSLFGNTQNNKPSIFGQPTNQQNTTGSSLFGGANQQKPAGSSLFGGAANQQQQQQSTSLFGSPQTQNSGGGGLFGNNSSANKTSIFGASNTNTTSSLFGSSSNNNAGNTGGGLFGSTNTSSNTGSSMFGASQQVSGTTIKFEPPIASDTMVRNGSTQNISTKHMCITAMSKYESKSIEELRIEDYMANRKTAGTGTTTGGGLFGASTTTTNTGGGGLFGNSSTPQKSIFGQSTSNNSFGAASGSGTQTNSLFGSSNTNNTTQGTSLFGNKPATTGGLFGTSTTSTFGNAQPQQQQNSLFGGSTTQNTGGGLFGQTAQPQQQNSLFGGNTSNTTGGGLFGNAAAQPAQNTGFSFGGSNATTNAFGQSTTGATTGGIFGNTQNTSATGSNLFGAKPATTSFGGFGTNTTQQTGAFGQNTANTSGGLFGNNAAKPGGLFGTTQTTNAGGGLFGGTQNTTGGGLFGGNNTATGNTLGFGQQQQQGGLLAQPAQQVLAQPQVAPIPVIGVTADVLQMQANMKLLQSQLVNAPYGDSTLLKYVTSPKNEETADGSAQRQLRFLAAKKSAGEKSSFLTAPISKVMSDLSPAATKTTTQSPGITRDLNYTSRETPPTLGKGLRTTTGINGGVGALNSSIVNKTMDSVLDASLNGSTNRLGVRGSVKKSNLKQLDMSVLADLSKYSQNGSFANDSDALPILREKTTNVQSPQSDPVQAVVQRQQDREKQPPILDLDKSVDQTSNSISTTSVLQTTHTVQPQKSVAGVKLTKPDYYTIPSMSEMSKMVKNGRIILENGLTIGRSSYGSVFWPGKIELSDVCFDEIVIFRHREVTVYPNEDEKPEQGEGLNKPAEVTLERIWYTDKKTKTEVRDVVKLAEIGWREHLERQTIRMGAVFKDFRAETGSWVFRVEHFSKYGLADDEEPMDIAPPPSQQPSAPLGAINLNTSIHDVQNQVQRQKVTKSPISANKSSNKQKRMEQHEYAIEVRRVPAAEPLSVATNIIQRGLGGGERNESENDYLEINETSIEYQEDGERPEKKPKIEILSDLEYESSRYLKAMLNVKNKMPNCVDPKNRFDGGKIEEKDLIGFGKSRFIDLGIAHGRSCRVGWSEMSWMCCSGQPKDNQILLCEVERGIEMNEEIVRNMLEANIETSESREETSRIVYYRGNGAKQLIEKYIGIAKTAGRERELAVWKLCAALFPQEREEGWQFERGEQVGEWLKNEAAKHAPILPAKSTPSAQIFHQLSIGNLEKAFEIASKNDFLNLAASLYSHSICPETTQFSFKQQIELWKKEESLHLLDANTLKCYLLLSGVSFLKWSLNGKQFEVNCLADLHWTQAFGCHVWYLRNWKGLDEAYQGYLEDVRDKRAASNRGDLLGELLKLCCEPQHSMEIVLDSASQFSSNSLPHDYSLIWHVWSVLRSVGYRTMEKSAETRMTRCYAAQLEKNLRLAKFAVFVLQHLENNEERETSIRSLLERISNFQDLPLFDVISRDFDVSKKWIADAQFVFAKNKGNISELFELAIKSENLPEIQKLFVEEIAPNAVVSSDLDTLRIACKMLENLEPKIVEWGANGRIFVDYCNLMDLIANEEDCGEQLEEVLANIEDRLHAPNFKNTVQKLALQSIVRELFEYRQHQQLGNELEWIKMLGNRQLHKIFRDTQLLQIDRYTIEYD
ncbi:unnamed protein product [Caenorhabditis angaria]|uniref:Nuclear pore complex protein Nup98-Nup96 n=1 Tax=Caenorhabditis angaria TaxID=860376 RepID=A0A9P1N2K7_9PELO|nr:unnamed protein product [Caenorhabditis angaria]